MAVTARKKVQSVDTGDIDLVPINEIDSQEIEADSLLNTYTRNPATGLFDLSKATFTTLWIWIQDKFNSLFTGLKKYTTFADFATEENVLVGYKKNAKNELQPFGTVPAEALNTRIEDGLFEGKQYTDSQLKQQFVQGTGVLFWSSGTTSPLLTESPLGSGTDLRTSLTLSGTANATITFIFTPPEVRVWSKNSLIKMAINATGFNNNNSYTIAYEQFGDINGVANNILLRSKNVTRTGSQLNAMGGFYDDLAELIYIDDANLNIVKFTFKITIAKTNAGGTDTINLASSFANPSTINKTGGAITTNDVFQVKDGVVRSLNTALQIAQCYDKIISTQEEFDELIADPDWLGATSVAFLGNNGPFKTTESIIIPITVLSIKGYNNATINCSSVDGTMYYSDTVEYSNNHSISGIRLIGFILEGAINITDCQVEGGRTSSGTFASAFLNCINIRNCTGTSNENSNNAAAFYHCRELENCKSYSYRIAYDTCTGVRNCENMNSNITSVVFSNCKDIHNCNVTLTNTSTNAFRSCVDIYNCEASISGKHTDTMTMDSINFYDCKNLVGCKSAISVESAIPINVSSFSKCSKLTNCEATSSARFNDGNSGVLNVYTNCSYMCNCVGEILRSKEAIARVCMSCNYIDNFTGTCQKQEYNDEFIGSNGGDIFYSCNNISNSTATGGDGCNGGVTSDKATGYDGGSGGNGFFNCKLLYNCVGAGGVGGDGGSSSTEGRGSSGGSGGNGGSGFLNCTYVNNCKGTGKTGGHGGFFNAGAQALNGIGGNGHISGIFMSQCLGEYIYMGLYTGNSFYNCMYMNYCKRIGTANISECYSGGSNDATYKYANTLNGGWNS